MRGLIYDGVAIRFTATKVMVRLSSGLTPGTPGTSELTESSIYSTPYKYLLYCRKNR